MAKQSVFVVHKWKKFRIIITAAGKAKLRKLSYCWQGQLLKLILHEWINFQINTPAANNAIKLMAVQMQPKLTNKQTKNQHHTFFPGERHTPLFPNPPCSLDSVNCYNITTFFHNLLFYNFTSNTNHALVLMQAILTLPCSTTVPHNVSVFYNYNSHATLILTTNTAFDPVLQCEWEGIQFYYYPINTIFCVNDTNVSYHPQ